VLKVIPQFTLQAGDRVIVTRLENGVEKDTEGFVVDVDTYKVELDCPNAAPVTLRLLASGVLRPAMDRQNE
jgi:signal peptidase I